MKSNNYGLHDECIYKKLEECEYSYIYCTSVKKLLVKFIGQFWDCWYHNTSYYATNKSVTEPACPLLEPIKIDYNFIEVSDGFCFDIEGKKFLRNPKRLKGFPRAYVRYTYHEDKIANLKPFIEGMDNIFVVLNKKNYLMFS